MESIKRTDTSAMCDVVPQLQRPNVVFDFGNVLIQWNPERLLREFAQDKEELSYLMTEVCSPEWNARMDRGEPMEQCCLERAELFPEYKDAIMAYGKRWFDMVPGEVPGMLELVKSLKGDGGIACSGFRISRRRRSLRRGRDSRSCRRLMSMSFPGRLGG